MPENKEQYNIGNSNLINLESSFNIGSSNNINSSNNVTIGDYDNFNINSSNNVTISDSNINLIASPDNSNLFWGFFGLVRITDKFFLREDEDNFFVIPNNRVVISWCEKKCCFIESELENFIHELREDNEFEKPYSNQNDKLGSVLSILLKLDGNYYVDLKENVYYKYSSERNVWIKMYGNINDLSFTKKENIKTIRESRANRTLISEKMSKNLKGLFGSGFIFAPYIPMSITTTTTGINTTSNILSRYQNIDLNYDNYNNLTITQNYV